MAGRVSGLAVAYTAAGFILLWSGWQNTTLRDTLTGFARGQVPHGTPTGTPSLAVQPAAASSSQGGTGAPAAPANVSGNTALGKMLAASRGWTGSEWNALYDLWQRESGWSNTIANSSSGAYGIAQALGHGTGGAPYPSTYQAANPPEYGGTSDARTQITWGLDYIASRYGTPAAAWAHEQTQGWY